MDNLARSEVSHLVCAVFSVMGRRLVGESVLLSQELAIEAQERVHLFKYLNARLQKQGYTLVYTSANDFCKPSLQKVGDIVDIVYSDLQRQQTETSVAPERFEMSVTPEMSEDYWRGYRAAVQGFLSSITDIALVHLVQGYREDLANSKTLDLSALNTLYPYQP